MSRGLRGNARVGFTDRLGGMRCVYCRKREMRKATLQKHEATCPSRPIATRLWAWQLQRFKARLGRTA